MRYKDLLAAAATLVLATTAVSAEAMAIVGMSSLEPARSHSAALEGATLPLTQHASGAPHAFAEPGACPAVLDGGADIGGTAKSASVGNAAKVALVLDDWNGAACTPRSQCCKVCETGKACGDSCISRSYTCHKGRGCACNSSEVCPY